MGIEKHFDQLMHVIRVQLDNISNAVQSIEIDLELPKGYVVKPKIIRIRSFGGAIGIGSTVTTHTLQAALVRDPDDGTSIEIPANATQHDVIFDYLNEVIYTVDQTNGLGIVHEDNPVEYIYLEEAGFDIITARNMRFNALGTASTSMEVDCTMWYTLESINKNEILEILDIL